MAIKIPLFILVMMRLIMKRKGIFGFITWQGCEIKTTAPTL